MAIDKDDLSDMKEDIKDHIDVRMRPVTDDIVAMRLTLYGQEGRNGIVGDVNDLKTSGRIMKWFVGFLTTSLAAFAACAKELLR